MAKITDPFVANPSTPSTFRNGSPLAENARQFAPRISVESVEEQTRAAGIPAEIARGERTPNFTPTRTPAPFTETTPVVRPRAPEAGGS